MNDGKELISRVDTAEAENKKLKGMCADAAEVVRGLREMLDTQAKIIACNEDLIRLLTAKEERLKARAEKAEAMAAKLAEALRWVGENPWAHPDNRREVVRAALAEYEASK